MNRPGLALSFTASLAVTMTLWPASARADVTKAQCLDANAKGQDLRRDGKLSAARKAFRQCADASCPSLLRDDCTRRLDDLEKAQPTIVFEAKDGSGNDLSAVEVTVDGLPLADLLTGTPLAVDPGEHTFTFQMAGQPTLQKKLVIRESEKDRRERITLGGPEEASSGLGTQKILALVAGGVGVVGLGLGTAFGLMALSKKSDAQSACPSSPCPTEDGSNKWSDAVSAGNVSTVGFIVAGLGVAGAAVLWFTAPSASGGASTQVGLGPGILRVNGTW